MSNSYSMEGTVPEPKNVIRHNLCTHRVYDSVEETKLKKKKIDIWLLPGFIVEAQRLCFLYQ